MMLVAAMMAIAGVASAQNSKGGSTSTSNYSGATVSGTQTSRSSGTTFTSGLSGTSVGFSGDMQIDNSNPNISNPLNGANRSSAVENERKKERETRNVGRHTNALNNNTANQIKPSDAFENARFGCGEADLWDWLIANLKFPEELNREKIDGVVLVEFEIAANGKVQNPTILRGLNPECDRAAIELIKSMPNWTPAQQEGVAVNSKYVLPVPFKNI